jgi:hypothetical protein
LFSNTLTTEENGMIRKFEELTKAEKEKLQSFLICENTLVARKNNYLHTGYTIGSVIIVFGVMDAVLGGIFLCIGILSSIAFGTITTSVDGIFNAANILMILSPIVILVGMLLLFSMASITKCLFKKKVALLNSIYGYASLEEACKIEEGEKEEC